jgi:hypothetical protein
MHRSESYPLHMALASLILVSCSAFATAAPTKDRDRVAQTQPTPALAVEHVRVPLTGVRDQAAMVLIGTALIRLAAAVRRGA